MYKIIELLRKVIYYLLNKDMMVIKINDYRKNGMKIGGGCRIFSKINSAEPYLIEIGNNVTISTNVELITHDNCAIKLYDDATDFVGSIKIGDNCFIGSRAIILPGVTIANNVIVAAGSVVTKSIKESGKIVGGNPAKEIGSIDIIREKNYSNRINLKNLNYMEKRKIILENENKWILK